MSAERAVFRPSLHGLRPAWIALWLACAGFLAGIDAMLLEWTQHPFSGGMAAAYTLRSVGRLAGYFGLAFVLDFVAVGLAWCLTLPGIRRLPLRPAQKWALAGMLGLAGPLVASFVRYRIEMILGPRLNLDALLGLAEGAPLRLLGETQGHQAPVVWALLAALLLAAALIAWLGRRRQSMRGAQAAAKFEAPPGTAVAWATTGALLPVFVGWSVACHGGGGLCTAVTDKPSGVLVAHALRLATDFDRDGYGFGVRPFDPAPFDAEIHPYALEIPGNGRDENGLGGDGIATVIEAGRDESPRFAARPHVLFVFLESFRADLLGQRLGGREVTPFLNRLAAEGSASDHAHSAYPKTVAARNQLFGGRLATYPGQTTMLHDFAANDYFVAYFSGQDESLGAYAEATLSLDQADVFYDARQDRDRNYYFHKRSGNLAVTSDHLLEKTGEFLAGYKDERPLFLYVNFHDTHYPYHHAELEDRLGVEALPRDQITPANAEAVRATYANAAANVDAAVAELVADFRGAIGDEDHVIVVTADHGESLFENGSLGHGLRLADLESRVPLIVWGLDGEWPQPIGLSEIRGRLGAALLRGEVASGPGSLRFRTDPERRLFQYLPDLRTPSRIALRGVDGSFHYDFERARFEARGPDDQPLALAPERKAELAAELIARWEAAARQHAAVQKYFP